jgi:leucyl-tRNA synthetase
LPTVGTEISENIDSNSSDLMKQTHKIIAGVTEDIEAFRFNKAVARLYELTNSIANTKDANPSVLRFALETLIRLMQPFTPHLSEEAWSVLGQTTPLVYTDWPVADEKWLQEDTVVLPIQINGKRRSEITVDCTLSPQEIEEIVRSSPEITRYFQEKAPKKIIVVPGRIVNVVL